MIISRKSSFALVGAVALFVGSLAGGCKSDEPEAATGDAVGTKSTEQKSQQYRGTYGSGGGATGGQGAAPAGQGQGR